MLKIGFLRLQAAALPRTNLVVQSKLWRLHWPLQVGNYPPVMEWAVV